MGVSSGKVLERDEDTLSAYGVKDGSKLICVKDLAKTVPLAASQPPQDAKQQSEPVTSTLDRGPIEEHVFKYQDELLGLKSMGFDDDEACMKALIKHSGNIDLAVNILAQDPDEGSN